ncbi:hypothetical protein QE152_g11402 [Popillia japonica]|uniref:Uncharacterized protein n=1 Tax=Popillia japonica TaxID=7064 RepID=A0AAW1LK73_POPJA
MVRNYERRRITHQNLEDLPVPQNKAPSGRAIKKQRRKNRNLDTTSSESSITPMYEESDNDVDFLSEDVFVAVATEKLEDFELHAWLLVKYCTKKTIKYYAGRITEMYKDICKCVVKFLHFNNLSKKFFWPETADVDTITYL